MPFYKVKNWDRFQHYKKRNPPWIKLYAELLDDFEMMALPPTVRWLAIGMLLLASRTDNRIPTDEAYLCNRLWVDDTSGVEKLVSVGFIGLSQDASTMLATCHSQTETEAEAETEVTVDKSTGASAAVENSNGENAGRAKWGALVEAIHEHLWLGSDPPGSGWTMGRDLHIAKVTHAPASELVDVCAGVRLLARLGKLPHVGADEPCTLRVVATEQTGTTALYQRALHAARKYGTSPPEKRTGATERLST